jgi:transcriptional regulator
MPQKRLNEKDVFEMVKMRGLGYSQDKIAQHLGVRQSAVQYQLSKLNERAENEGINDVFLALIAGAALGAAAVLILQQLFENK